MHPRFKCRRVDDAYFRQDAQSHADDENALKLNAYFGVNFDHVLRQVTNCFSFWEATLFQNRTVCAVLRVCIEFLVVADGCVAHVNVRWSAPFLSLCRLKVFSASVCQAHKAHGQSLLSLFFLCIFLVVISGAFCSTGAVSSGCQWVSDTRGQGCEFERLLKQRAGIHELARLFRQVMAVPRHGSE